MAINYASLQATVNREFLEPITDAVSRANPTLAATEKVALASDAIYIKAKLSSDHGARGIDDGSNVAVTGAGSSRKAAQLDWVTYVADFSVNKRVIKQLEGNPGALGKVLYDEIQDAALDLVDRIGADILGTNEGNVTTKVAGIQDIVSATNIYAGIDRAQGANANWRSTVVDAAVAGNAGPLSTLLFDKADRAFFDRNYWSLRERAGFFTGVTTSALIEKYQQLFTSITLGDLATAHFVNQMNMTGMFGESVLGYMGVPLVRDHNVANNPTDLAGSSRLYFLNMRQIKLAVLDPSQDAVMNQVQGALSGVSTENIKIEVELLPNAGERIDGYVKAYVQLFSPNPKEAGVLIKNIDIA